ncbi:isoamylase [Treponema pedis]|nr:isoamylase [Treponema pedis]QOW60103.1 isoamylase [Treponema pedis]QSI05451.1 isoamylase [Treponema pedis]
MRKIKKKFIFFLVSVLSIISVFAEQDEYVYGQLVETISRVGIPKIEGRYIIFTASGKRHAGISFAHEDYRHIHSFKKLVRSDFQSDAENQILFYIFQIPDGIGEIRYRLVIDGLWSSDPENPDSVFDYTHGMSVSVVNVPFYKEYKTSIEGKNLVRFTYIGEAKQRIKLAGTFNNWDPFMYEMEEVVPGRYELALNLPKGTWFYAYFSGSMQLPDSTNKNYVYTADGRRASVITIQ